MTLEQNKQAAMEFFRRFDADDIDGALATMADDVSWWLAGKPSRFRVGGAKTKAQMAEIFRVMRARLKDGLRMRVTGAIAEGDKVALEVVSRGELVGGRLYENEYHVLVTLREGRIIAAREYNDTQHAHDVWFAP